MKKAIAMKWVAALRSGKYKQAPGILRKVNYSGETAGFCCLGVLCNLHAQEHPKIAAKEKNPSWYLGENRVLPDKVMAWSGVKDPCGSYEVEKGLGSEAFSLASLNDSRGWSFMKIADFIEKSYKEL